MTEPLNEISISDIGNVAKKLKDKLDFSEPTRLAKHQKGVFDNQRKEMMTLWRKIMQSTNMQHIEISDLISFAKRAGFDDDVIKPALTKMNWTAAAKNLDDAPKPKKPAKKAAAKPEPKAKENKFNLDVPDTRSAVERLGDDVPDDVKRQLKQRAEQLTGQKSDRPDEVLARLKKAIEQGDDISFEDIINHNQSGELLKSLAQYGLKNLKGGR